MKIYLGFTVAGSRSSIEAAKKILNVLQSLGHEVLTSHLVNDDAWEADRRMAPQKIFARDMNWLAQCDLFVAEVTGSSAYSRRTPISANWRSWFEGACPLLNCPIGATAPERLLVKQARFGQRRSSGRKGMQSRHQDGTLNQSQTGNLRAN